MNLILMSNSGILEQALKIIAPEPHILLLAHIITAGKDVKDTSYLDRTRAKLEQLSVMYEDIDIENEANSEDELYKLLSRFDVIYVNGGNTFYLMKVMRELGFERVVRRLLAEGKWYIGSSAGSYVASLSIEMSNWKETGEYRHNDHGLTDFSGMGLVPISLYVHFAEEKREFIHRKIEAYGYPVQVLSDGQMLVSRDNDVQLVGGPILPSS